MSTIPVVKNDTPTQLGGRKKKGNGHKANCGCPICKNMRGTKRGGGEEEDTEFKMGGKKKNGHKANCGCPICVNMKHAKGTKRNRHNKRGGSKRRKRGGRDEIEEEPEEVEVELEDEDEYEDEPEDEDEDEAKEDIEEDSDEEDEGNEMNEDNAKEGGRKKKKKNGHKANCKYPICKNMKKNKRGGEDGDIENQKGDIEEGFVKGEKIVDIETKAGDEDYEEIEKIQKMEEGEGPGPYNPQAYENVGGRRRKNKTRKSRKYKTRRHRKRTRRHRRKM
jgi:hypothetical protein